MWATYHILKRTDFEKVTMTRNIMKWDSNSENRPVSVTLMPITALIKAGTLLQIETKMR